MNIYTKTGDNGSTNLMKLQNVSKTDDRIQCLGTIDELTSQIGAVKAFETNEEVRKELERIQRNLMKIMAAIADQFNKEYKFSENEVTRLEEEIDRLETSFERKKEFVLPGSNPKSAQIDVARTIARRAERTLIAVDKKFNADAGAKKYMNRLADYLYMLARYNDNLIEKDNTGKINQPKEVAPKMVNDDLVNAVLSKLGLSRSKIDLHTAKKLIEKVEEHAVVMGLNAVIAVCGPDGNTIAVHVMDNAFLASFDIAMKKAYTSVAVKMTTQKLGELAQPGGTFYGIDKADNGRMIIFGGGVPLYDGDNIIGGLGVSGGVSEVDAELAEFGAAALAEILG
jgi:ATP:cob(I)alamin adenosyltransferase